MRNDHDAMFGPYSLFRAPIFGYRTLDRRRNYQTSRVASSAVWASAVSEFRRFSSVRRNLSLRRVYYGQDNADFSIPADLCGIGERVVSPPIEILVSRHVIVEVFRDADEQSSDSCSGGIGYRGPIARDKADQPIAASIRLLGRRGCSRQRFRRTLLLGIGVLALYGTWSVVGKSAPIRSATRENLRVESRMKSGDQVGHAR